jgi:hypothetical protein
MSNKITTTIHMVFIISLAFWAGGALFFSYVTAPGISRHLQEKLPFNTPPGLDMITPKAGSRLAREVARAILPSYFATQILAGLPALAAGFLMRRREPGLGQVRIGLVAAALAIAAGHAVTVHGRTVQLHQLQLQAENSGAMRKAEEFRREYVFWDNVSQILNLGTILLVTTALTATVASTVHKAANPTLPPPSLLDEQQ